MRLTILAVGSMRGTPEGQLVDDFVDRARKLGRSLGFTAVAVEEVAVSRQRDVAVRMKDEAERLAHRLPDGAHLVLLDAGFAGEVGRNNRGGVMLPIATHIVNLHLRIWNPLADQALKRCGVHRHGVMPSRSFSVRLYSLTNC